jgi:HYR domain/Secretion system C-terminal sorting domain/Fn3 associated/Lamin Tail Domain
MQFLTKLTTLMKKIIYVLFLLSAHCAFSQTQSRTKVAAGNDDVEVSSTTFYVSSSDLEVGGFDAAINGKQYVAIRFQNVVLPTNAQISRAYIQFTTNIPLSQSASVTIKCQQGNAAAYLTTENLLLRTYVPSVVTWNPPAWTVANESGVNQQTANLSAQITAAVATGWTSGNALSFILDGNAAVNNVLNARSFETAAGAGAAELVIEYTTGGNACSPDVTPPTFVNCPTNINLTTVGTSAVATWTVPTVSDFCTANITPSVSSAPTAGLGRGSAFPIGTTTITYTARDAANNVATPCVFTVTVSTNNPCSPDVTPPTFVNCPTNINLTTASNTEIGTWTTPTVSDVCTANITPSVSSAPTPDLRSSSLFPIGATTITYTARDAANNNAIPCTFIVSVRSNTGSNTLTIPISNGNDDVEVSATNFYVGSSDLELGGFDTGNNGAQYVALRFQNVAIPANAQITKAYIQFTSKIQLTTTASVAIKCQKGNAAAYNPAENLQLRTYLPNTATWNPTAWAFPNFQGVDQQTVNLSALVAGATATGWTSGNALSFILQGNATIDNVLNARSYETLPSHDGAPQLVIEYATNGGLCSPDLVAPTFSNCPVNISVTTAGTTGIANWTPPTVSDFCTPNINPLFSTAPTAGLASGSAFPLGVTTVTYVARDAANNAAIPCVFTITVTANNPCVPDIVRPIIVNCPANISLTTAGTTAVATWTTPTVSDFCTPNITPSVSSAPTIGLVSSSAFPLGVTTVTYTARDAANNVATPCIFTVTVGVNNQCVPDLVAPIFSKCPAPLSFETTGTTAVATWTAPTVFDFCTPNLTPTLSTSPTAGLGIGSAFPIGVTTVTYTARDGANNAATPCVFTITVTNTAPISTLFINEVAPQGTIAINSDWIELYNDGTTTASLNDVYITNKIATPFKWQLTGLTIPAKGFLVLFADNDTLINRTHLNFKVSASGEKIYLNRNVNGAAVQLAFFESPTSPPDEDNVTFGGLIEGQPTPLPAALTKFLGGTPNAANAGGLRYVKVANSLPRGILTAPAAATLSTSAGVTIRYTTDNSFPSRTNGIIYTQPIPITATTVLKTFAYSLNSETKPEAFTYIFPVKGSELTFPNLVTAAEYESGMKLLPIVSLSTTLDTLDNRTEKMASFEYISKFGQNTSIGVLCGVNGYGNDSYIYSDQRNLRMSFKNLYGYGNLEFPLFTRDPVDTYNPTTKFDVLDLKIGQDGPNAGGFGMLMTSQSLISKNMREMGNIDLHTQYAHAFVNGKYHGIYTFKEHWDEHFAQTYYGGNKDFYDQVVEGESYGLGDINRNSSGQPQGNLINWIALRNAGRAFDFQLVKNYLNMQQYIDYQLNVMMFDAQWEYRAFADQSLKATKFVFENHDSDGAVSKVLDPYITDHNLKWGTTVDYPEIFNGPGEVFGHIYDSGNKEFKTLVRDRVYEAMQKPTGALTAGRLATKLNELRSVLLPAFNMELARFNKTFYNNNPYYDEEFNAEIAYLPTRFSFTLNKWLEKGLTHTLVPVTFNQPSGSTVTTPVLATNPNNRGVVYYTVDGSDPMGNDGIISPLARLYSNQLVLNTGVNNVVARVYFNTEFGPKTKAIYTNNSLLLPLSAQIMVAEGRLDGDKAVLNWYTKATQGADYFKVEKLNSNGIFETLETVDAQFSINLTAIEEYKFVEEKLNEGDNIYRIALYSAALKQPLYSDLITVKYNESHLFDIHPNPTANFIDIDLKVVEKKAVTVSIFNSIGTIVLSEKIDKASPSQRINVESLQDGQYFMAIQAQGKRVVMKKFVKMR